MIRAYVDKTGTSDAHFERFFGMNRSTIDRTTRGWRRMPPRYWHFFYEGIVPAYGVGFIGEVAAKKSKKDKYHHISSEQSSFPLQNRHKTGESTISETERVKRLLNSK